MRHVYRVFFEFPSLSPPPLCTEEEEVWERPGTRGDSSFFGLVGVRCLVAIV